MKRPLLLPTAAFGLAALLAAPPSIQAAESAATAGSADLPLAAVASARKRSDASVPAAGSPGRATETSGVVCHDGLSASPGPGGDDALASDGGRAEDFLLAQSTGTTGTGTSGRRGAPTGLPPGDSLPGWSGPRGGTAATPPPPSGALPGIAPGTTPGGLIADPALGGNARGGGMVSGPPSMTAGPTSSSMTGGEPARSGGSPPGDTSRSPGSSGFSGAGVGGSGVGGPIR